MRGVTRDDAHRTIHSVISTRTPHAGSDFEVVASSADHWISTRTPHAGSDPERQNVKFHMLISTRTPHAGSDFARSA